MIYSIGERALKDYSSFSFSEDEVAEDEIDEIDDEDDDDDEDYSEAEPLDFDTYYSFNDEDLDLDGRCAGTSGSSGRAGGDNIYNNNDDPEFFVYDCLEVDKAQKTLQDQVTVVCNVTKVLYALSRIFSKMSKKDLGLFLWSQHQFYQFYMTEAKILNLYLRYRHGSWIGTWVT